MTQTLQVNQNGFIARHRLSDHEQIEAVGRICAAIQENNLRLIRVAWCDRHGISRAKTLTVPAFLSALEDGIDFNTGPLFFDTANAIVFNPFIKGGGFDLEELTGCPNYGLVPDRLHSASCHGHRKRADICDAYLKTGAPLPFDSRQLARKAFKELNEKGYDLYAGLEVEFSLTKIVSDEIRSRATRCSGKPC